MSSFGILGIKLILLWLAPSLSEPFLRIEKATDSSEQGTSSEYQTLENKTCPLTSSSSPSLIRNGKDRRIVTFYDVLMAEFP